jgi:predicted negative regulator of RcsB-dependent stress response
VDPYQTEEDQVRAIRQWWARNGSSTLIGVGLALAIVFGSQWWQQRNLHNAEEAAALYQQLQQAAERAAGDEVQRTTALHLGEELRDKQSGKRYGDYASLLLAKLYIEKKDLAAAERELRALVERHPDTAPGKFQQRINALLGRDVDPQLGSLARLRLARVLFADNRADEAATVLGDPAGGDFEIERQELRGDILRAKGDADGAIAAWERAIELAKDSGGVRLVELKLQELRLTRSATPAAAAVTPTAATPTAATPAEEKKTP